MQRIVDDSRGRLAEDLKDHDIKRNDNVYNFGQWVPRVVCPCYGDDSESIYELNNLNLTEAYIRYNVIHDRLEIEVDYECETKISNNVHGIWNAEHLQICCNIENAEIKSQFLNVIENKFDLDETDYELEYRVQHEEIDFSKILWVNIIEMYGIRKISIYSRDNSGVYKLN